ncbi:hypothetical protein ABIC89_002906 [Variovorax boronicumulans]|uniref:hypothetical protein n=1 Tax=Variovorax boronicumulans TaxID=436515 RepID=UPI0033968C97
MSSLNPSPMASSSFIRKADMKNEKWETTILSDTAYEHLVAELSFDGQFLLLLDREEGREHLCVAFPAKDGSLGSRIPLPDFIAQLNAAAADLRR